MPDNIIAPADPAPAPMPASPLGGPAASAAPGATARDPNQKTVILVEDDLFLSNLLASRLIRAGVNLVKIYDGEQAMVALRAQKPDLVVLDIIIPKKSGFEVLEEIRGEPTMRDLPVMVLSNLGQDADIARATQLGAVKYFIKAQNSIGTITDAIMDYLQI